MSTLTHPRAFLARLTNNRTLLKQMVGRVLSRRPVRRVPRAAHVVDFRDDWA
jgi:hypothetical protein